VDTTEVLPDLRALLHRGAKRRRNLFKLFLSELDTKLICDSDKLRQGSGGPAYPSTDADAP
jgi:hypothetical protein